MIRRHGQGVDHWSTVYPDGTAASRSLCGVWLDAGGGQRRGEPATDVPEGGDVMKPCKTCLKIKTRRETGKTMGLLQKEELEGLRRAAKACLDHHDSWREQRARNCELDGRIADAADYVDVDPPHIAALRAALTSTPTEET